LCKDFFVNENNGTLSRYKSQSGKQVQWSKFLFIEVQNGDGDGGKGIVGDN